MSEGDVSLIRDEDLLRRMWQQTEDFSRKKEIRAHMYRLREERLRNLYSPEPPLDTGKGCEFTSAQGHVKSFADQSFQSMKSKEVRDAGSPPKEFTYRGQDLKELSNAGWNVESENRTTDDGNTHVKSVQANIEGRYDVDGGKGQFAAIDLQKEAVTEYHDDHTSLKKNEASSKTAAHEQVVRKTDDGTQFSSTTSSSTSTSKFQQVSSSKHETVPFVTNDDYDLSRQTSYDTNRNVDETTNTQVTRTSDYEQSLRRSEFESGQLESRKVEYPDDNTKIIVETKRLPDGSLVTSTRREFRAPAVHTSRADQHMHSQQTRHESKSSYTSKQKHSDVRESSCKITGETVDNRTKDIVDSQKNIDNFDFNRNQQINYSTTRKDDYSETQNRTNQQHHESKVHLINQENYNVDRQQYDTLNEEEQHFKTKSDRKQYETKIVDESDRTHFESKIDKTDRREITPRDDEVIQKDVKKSQYVQEHKDNEERIHMITKDKKVNEIVENKTSDQYQTTYQTDFSQKKVSMDWSPTHQAWASTLRADTPPTTRSPTRAYSPGSRTFQSSTSSLRSSISPDKTYRKPDSRGGSPSKVNRYSPSRTVSDKYSSTHSTTGSVTETKTTRYTSPGRKQPLASSPTRPSYGSDRKSQDGYRQRPSVSPDKSPRDFTHRPSASPERKPGYKSNPADNYPRTGSPTKPFDRDSSPTKSSCSPERKPGYQPLDSNYPRTTSPYRSSISPEKKPSQVFPRAVTPTRNSQITDTFPQKSKDAQSNYLPRSTSPSRPLLTTATRPSASPERKPGYQQPLTKKTSPERKLNEKEPCPTRPSVSPDRKHGYMRPTAASKPSPTGDSPRTSPTRTYTSPDRKSPVKHMPSQSPERKPYSSTVSQAKEDHYRFVDEETKFYTRTDDEDIGYTRKTISTSPEKYSVPRDKSDSPTRKSPAKDTPDYCRPESPSTLIRPTLRKDSRSPSPPKGPVTFIHDKVVQDNKYDHSLTDVTIKYDDYTEDVTKQYRTPKDFSTTPQKKSPAREPSPSKYGTYNKKESRSEEVEEVTVVNTKDTKEDNYDSLTRRTSPKKDTFIREPSPTKGSPKKDAPVREPSPSNSSPKKDASIRQPSPSKYETYDKKQRRSEELDEVTITTTKDVKYDSLKRQTTPKKGTPIREPSPTKYGSYNKNERRSEEVEEMRVTTTKNIKEDKSDSLTCSEKSITTKKLSDTPGSPTKKSPRNSVSPLKPPTKDIKHKVTTDFIATEKKSEEINKVTLTKDRPRQLITPSTSPTRKPKPVETEPSTGQSSPTTSVSGFVYFSSPRMEKSIVTDLEDDQFCSETNRTEEVTTYKRPEDLDIKKTPSPSKIPCRSPSPEKRVSPTIDSLPRKSSLKKPSMDTVLDSHIEKPPSSFRVSPPTETSDFSQHKVVKKDRPDKPDTDSPKPKPPLERRETYEERCRKILGMMDDNTTTTKTVTKETTSFSKVPKSNLSSPSVSPCPSPETKEGSPLREQPITKVTETKYNVTDVITREKEDAITKVRDRIPTNDRKIRTPSRDSSPTKLQDIITETKIVTRGDVTSREDIKEDSTYISKTISDKQPSANSSLTPTRKAPEKPSSIPMRSVPLTKKPDEPRSSRTSSPTKKSTVVTEDITDFIASEREREILDRVQKSLRKLSPNRNERSPSREKSPSKTTTCLQDLEITTYEKIGTYEDTSNDIKDVVEKTSVSEDIKRPRKPKEEKNMPSKPSSRNASPAKKTVVVATKTDKSPESPTKPRSVSPRKPLAQTERPHSPQVPKTSAIKPKEPVPSHIVRKPSTGITSPTKIDKTVTTDVKKTTSVAKQNSFTSKTSTAKITTNRTTQSSSSKPTETEPKRTPITKSTKESVSTKKDSDIKVTRTISDVSLKTKKTSPQRMRSKPEIQINDLSTTRTNKQTTTRTKTQKSTIKEPQKLVSKPKSATALNTTSDEDDIIIDVEQAKSSRETSPDRICPTPINFLDDVGTPRLPDEVSEPDDEFRNRAHHTIHEAESIVDDIVEISEDDELFVKMTNVNRVAEADECLLSVNDKVSKFNKVDTVLKTKDSTTKFKDTERGVHSDFTDEKLKSDECLLTVSEKVNKFAKGPRDTKDRSPLRRIVDEYDKNTVYQDDYTMLSVNDKAHLFVETAEKSKTTKTKPAQKVERPDLSNVDDSLKSDDCLLSVSDKVNKFVKTAEQFLTESHDVEEKETKIKEQHEKIMKKITESTNDEVRDIKKTVLIEQRDQTDRRDSEHHDDKLGSFAKETASSHAKAKDYISPNIRPTEKNPAVKITTLRSSEAVKKAKALFENIASTTQKTKDTTQTKTTKLTDIGVVNKSPKTDSTIVLHPSLEDDSPNNTDSEVDNTPSSKNRPSSGTLTRPYQSDRGFDDKPRNSPTRLTTPEVARTKSPVSQRAETVIVTKTVLSKQPITHRPESPRPTRPLDTHEKPQDKIPSYQRPTKTSQIREETKTIEESEVISRRGSGKFGVELRRTSVERSTVSSERRRSSGDHHQPCIEDIFDLDLLEQMLEKVVGYEQRRRIRAQMRIAKKMDSEQAETTYTKTTKQTTVTKTPQHLSKTRSPERVPKSTAQRILSPERPAKSPHKTISPDRSHSKEPTKPILNGHAKESAKVVTEKRQRPHSPEKATRKSVPRVISPVRHPSPDKKTRTQSPSKTTSKPKSSRFSEYATAYMKRVGLNEADKVKISDVKTKKVTDIEDHRTVKQVEEHRSMETKSTSISKSFTERTSSKDTIEVVKMNGKRSPSPEKRISPERKPQSPTERLHQRTPSLDFKRPKTDSSKKETIIKTVYDTGKKIQPKQTQEEKPSWVTNRNLKKVTSETRAFSNKKMEVEKPKYRSTSPSKVISKPIDVITSSYGPGPLDADGRPLFGIRALKNGANNYQVKGTVIRQEYHSRNGSEPEGTVSVTAYSTEPEDLERLLQSQGERPSRIHGLAAITTTKKFGGETGTTLNEVHTKEERARVEEFTGSDRRVSDTKLNRGRNMESRREERREDKKTVRQSSVKSLTEKYIKSASDTSKSERSAYPKAGLILRTANMKDSVSSDSSAHAGLGRTDSEHSLASLEDTVTTTEQVGDVTRTTTTTTRRHHTQGQSAKDEQSFLDSTTKVTGVQDILSRMKNADIVIEEGDSNEDAEARALLNKFLGASVLMAGMQSYVTEKPGGKVLVKQETVRKSGDKVTTNRSVQELDLDHCWDERVLKKLLDECTDYEQRRRLRGRIRTLMAEQEACASAVTEALAAAGESTETTESNDAREEEEVTTVTSSVRRNSSEKSVSTSTTTKTSKVIESAVRPAPKPVSPFAKFRQLEKQNSTNTPNSPATPQSPSSGQPLFKFTEPALQASANTIKERLLQWCRDKTRDYENVKLENFSTSWADGMAFCALIHHFVPDAFDYAQLSAERRRHNFTLAFKVADEKAGIYPLLDVEDMVSMRRPDWKCVFTYVQAIHRRFKDH